MSNVRTRFAPSPTGYMHVGGVRTALFAWLVARQAGGQFLLRIEDTDRAREVAGADKHIKECLNWLGLDYDEDPIYQSHQKEKYSYIAKQLLDNGRAYADPRTPEELNKLRDDARAKKKPFLIRNFPLEKLSTKWEGNVPLRFKSEPKAYKWHDEVLGDLESGSEVIDDFILMKTDLFPTYNFAHIVDDNDMRITYIIRGQEFLPSIPNYLNLYDALGLKNPIFATVPHILNEHGNKKLSKRDGAKDVLDYRKDGYLPEAIVNFLASLGWNDGTQQEIFTREELIQKFSLSRVQRSGSRFDEKRLEWMNGHFIRELSLEDLASRVKNFWPVEAKDTNNEYKNKVLELVQERLKYLSELPELSLFFFKDLPFDQSLVDNDKQLSKLSTEVMKDLLNSSKNELAESDFSREDLTTRLNGLLGLTHTKPAVLFSLIRLATTNAKSSPPLSGTLYVLGKEKSLARIDNFLSRL